MGGREGTPAGHATSAAQEVLAPSFFLKQFDPCFGSNTWSFPIKTEVVWVLGRFFWVNLVLCSIQRVRWFGVLVD